LAVAAITSFVSADETEKKPIEGKSQSNMLKYASKINCP
jgi:hypothetical protein